MGTLVVLAASEALLWPPRSPKCRAVAAPPMARARAAVAARTLPADGGAPSSPRAQPSPADGGPVVLTASRPLLVTRGNVDTMSSRAGLAHADSSRSPLLGGQGRALDRH